VSDDHMRRMFGSLEDLPADADPAFVAQLRRRVVDIARSDPGSPIESSEDSVEEPIMIMLETEKKAHETVAQSRLPRWLLAAAAILLVVGVGVAVLVSRDDDSTTDLAADGGAGAIEFAEEFVLALNSGDVDTVTDLLADDGVFGFGSRNFVRDEIGSFLDFRAATGDRDEVQGCDIVTLEDVNGAIQVRCDLLFTNRWADALDAGQFESTANVRILDGLITSASIGAGADTFGPAVVGPYMDFITSQDPTGDDLNRMFAFRDDGMGILGPQYTYEAIELHARYTDEFEATNSGG